MMYLRIALLCLTIFVICPETIVAQQFNPTQNPNTFRSADNPNYWKNKPPYAGYWQQDVHYIIDAEIDEKTDIITGTEELTYWNNSPHTLNEVYFHLYQNAFQPGSYYDAYQKGQGRNPQYGERYEANGLGTVIDQLSVTTAAGKRYENVELILDNTILKVLLPEPLAPNSNVVFNLNFKTYFDAGTVRRRMKVFNAYKPSERSSKTDPEFDYNDHGNKHYDGVHWYPRISVFDRKFGWTTDQHLGREYYGDFGTFDVSLTFADHMVVEATGFLQNRNEVLPSDLREKLDIKNFATKRWNSAPSEITPYTPGKKKTWIYHAENVHDFAFTADPTYRIGEVTWNGIKAISLAREHHAAGWQNAASYSSKIIEFFSNKIGSYEFNKIIVADAKDGMEYPMITLDGGTDPGYRNLFFHEIGHQWFYGMVGTNETYRAALDEGFTQFIEVVGLQAIEGKYMPTRPTNRNYLKRWKEKNITMDARAYSSYLRDAKRGIDPPINIHSDHFKKPRSGYRHVYYKTATMLFNLEYVLGEELFWGAMQHYFDQWKMAHPYFDDFRKSMTEYTGVDLNWFFDSWIETSQNIDYGIKKVKETEGNAAITFERIGDMQMPIDFTVITNGGKKYKYHIPNTWFVKETDAEVLDKWTGWGDFLNKEHTVNVKAPGGIKNIIIDPSNRLADINMLNNRKAGNVKFEFDHHLREPSNRYHYDMKWRPALWYNAFDGVKAGIHLDGDYFDYKHKFDGAFFVNSRIGQYQLFDHEQYNGEENDHDVISFWANYKTSMDKIIPTTDFYASAWHLDGYDGFKVGLARDVNAKHKLTIQLKAFQRADSTDLNYLFLPEQWEPGKWNNNIDLIYDYNYSYSYGRGALKAGIRANTLFSDYNSQSAYLQVINKNRKGKLDYRTRFYAHVGSGDFIPQSGLYLAGANLENMMDNKYTRSIAFFPKEWADFGNVTNHFHHGGGLNLRGYAGYFVPVNLEDSGQELAFAGLSGFGFNTEFEFDKYLRGLVPRWKIFRPFHLDTYVFGDVGTISYLGDNNKKQHFIDPRFDLGVGAALSIKRWGVLQTVKPLTIRFDMPLILSHTPAQDPEHFQFRWVIGVNRAF